MLHPAIPILAQPFAIKSWILVVALECRQCQHETLIQVVAGLQVACPSCGAGYEVAGMTWDLARGHAAKFQVSHGPPASERTHAPTES